MSQKNLVLYEENISNFLRGNEVKALATHLIEPQESRASETPFVFDPKSAQENFFFKHAKIITTNRSKVDIAIPKDVAPAWTKIGEIAAMDQKGFAGKFPICSIVLKNLFYVFLMTNDMIEDLSIKVEEYFAQNINKSFNEMIITSLLYGDGQAAPLGILHASNKVAFQKLAKEHSIIQKMIDLYSGMRLQNNISSPIWIMNPLFHAQYLKEALNMKTSISCDRNTFMNIPIYETALMNKEKHGCILADLQSCFCIVFNESLSLTKQKDLFYTKIGVQAQLGVYCNDVAKFVSGLEIRAEN